jgi:hypothetical protein
LAKGWQNAREKSGFHARAREAAQQKSLIFRGERSGLLTRIAATVSGS